MKVRGGKKIKNKLTDRGRKYYLNKIAEVKADIK